MGSPFQLIITGRTPGSFIISVIYALCFSSEPRSPHALFTRSELCQRWKVSRCFEVVDPLRRSKYVNSRVSPMDGQNRLNSVSPGSGFGGRRGCPAMTMGVRVNDGIKGKGATENDDGGSQPRLWYPCVPAPCQNVALCKYISSFEDVGACAVRPRPDRSKYERSSSLLLIS